MSNPQEKSVFESERLLFRCWRHTDLDALMTFCSDPQVMQLVGNGSPWSFAEGRQFLAKEIENWRQHGYCRWALVAKSADRPQVVGFCGFVPSLEGLEIGWRLAADQWGQGLATEASLAAIGYAQEHLAANQLVATIQSGNIASQRVATKAGLRFDKTIDRHGQLLQLWLIRLSAGVTAVNISNRKQSNPENLA